jgi:hypothetical protein
VAAPRLVVKTSILEDVNDRPGLMGIHALHNDGNQLVLLEPPGGFSHMAEVIGINFWSEVKRDVDRLHPVSRVFGGIDVE